jgi:hypothetical protein
MMLSGEFLSPDAVKTAISPKRQTRREAGAQSFGS